jgi:hypothetical protein
VSGLPFINEKKKTDQQHHYGLDGRMHYIKKPWYFI